MATRPGDERMLRQLEQFVRVGFERNFFIGPNREDLYRRITLWIPAFRGAMDPAEVSSAHRKVLAPHLKVFERSHECVSAFVHLFHAWGAATQKTEEVEAKIPRLTVGEDEEEDLVRLKSWPPVFTQLFGAQGLPHLLTAHELKKQVAAHETSQKALPTTTAGQVYRATYSTLKRLRAEGIEYFERMHDLLDGEMGRGPESLAKKAEFGYDKHLRGGGKNRQYKKKGEQPKPEEKKTKAPKKPGPVASGTAGSAPPPAETKADAPAAAASAPPAEAAADKTKAPTARA